MIVYYFVLNKIPIVLRFSEVCELVPTDYLFTAYLCVQSTNIEQNTAFLKPHCLLSFWYTSKGVIPEKLTTGK